MTVPLSKKQVGHLVTEANTLDPDWNEAGFTVKATREPGGSIQRPRDRYLVGGAVKTDTAAAPLTSGRLTTFMGAHESILHQSEHYAGAWHEGSRGEVDLDVSQGHPRTAAGEEAARTSSVTRNEKAYGEIDTKGDYAGSVTNPFSTQRKPMEHLEALRSDPGAYADVVSGDVLGGMSSWSKRRPVRQSKTGS